MFILQSILGNETLMAVVGGAVLWAGRSLWGFFRTRIPKKVETAIDTATSLGSQFVTSGATMTPKELITALQGVFAIQLAKAGIYEAARKPFQPLIDGAIASLVDRWYMRHSIATIPPIAKKLP